MRETSKIIKDGKIKVYPDGTIYRLQADGSWGLAPQTQSNKYKTVSAHIDGKQKHFIVHRLVAEAFVPNPDHKPNVTHKDGCKSNNHMDNLEWVSKSEHALIAANNKRTLCKICGNATCSEDKVCTLCKRRSRLDLGRAEAEKKRKSDIDEEMSKIDITLLTPLERKTVELRKQYLIYEVIGEIMGCSRQRVEQRLKSALIKSLSGPKVRKGVVDKTLKMKNYLAKLQTKKYCLENNIAAIQADIDFVKMKLELIENDSPAAGTAKEP